MIFAAMENEGKLSMDKQLNTIRGYWIHEEVPSVLSTTGYFKLPWCECSNCGFFVQQEVNFCPNCGQANTEEGRRIVRERWAALNDGKGD